MIYARQVNSGLSTFGWSLSAGMDLDRNEYPDLLVGAYDSASAVHLRSAPVVHVEADVAFRTAGGRQVDLDRKNCNLRDGTRVPCVDFEATITYTPAPGAPDSISERGLLLIRRRCCQIRKPNRSRSDHFFFRPDSK